MWMVCPTYRRQEFLRHPEVGLDRIDRVEIDQRLPRGDVLADADLAQADDAGERRHDMRLLELHARELDGGVVHGEIGGRLVGRLGGGVFVAEQLRGALVGLLGELELGLGVGELRLIDRIVEGEERRALIDRLAFLEMDFLEAAGDLRADRHRLVGQQRADRGHLLAQRRGDHLRRLDRHRLALFVLGLGAGANDGKAGSQQPPSRPYAPSERHFRACPAAADDADNLAPIRRQGDGLTLNLR